MDTARQYYVDKIELRMTSGLTILYEIGLELKNCRISFIDRAMLGQRGSPDPPIF